MARVPKARRRFAPNPGRPVFGPRQARFFWHVAELIVPEAARLDRNGRRRLRLIVGSALNQRPPFERFQLRLFLLVVQWLPAVFLLRPLDRLPPRTQSTILRLFENAPLGLVRAGFWGL